MKKETNKKGTMKKNILVKFDLQIGEYEHQDSFIFNNKKTEYGYCKEFWNLNKKDELKENVFWDNQMLNAISVYSETEITNEQDAIILAYDGVVASGYDDVEVDEIEND